MMTAPLADDTAPIATTTTDTPAAPAVDTTVEDAEDAPARPGWVTLDEPIVRGNLTIKEVYVRKPKSGELRGLSLTSILNLDYTALEALLPRVTLPRLLKQDIAALDTADLMQLGGEVIGFLLPKAAKDSVPE